MTVDDFIAATQKVIASDGFENYLPTLLRETSRAMEFAVLEDMPPDADVESFAKNWALKVAKRKQDYLLAFKVDDAHFKVVSRLKGVMDERLVAVGSP